MQFYLYLPQMWISFDRLVASARAAESAGFAGIAGRVRRVGLRHLSDLSRHQGARR
jgi:hypothetical protein